jgi:hypothetical protein
LHIANLEGAGGRRSSCRKDNPLCFPIQARLLDLLPGFDFISLENNHSMDLGLSALRRTIAELKKRGVVPLGGKAPSAILETGQGNIGVLAVTDTVNAARGVNFLLMADSPRVLLEIKKLKARCTLVAIYIHWGREFDKLPTERMRSLAARFIHAGADLIVGTHPHVFGKVERIRGCPVIYSLGNFLFDQKFEETKSGAILHCKIDSGFKASVTLRGIEVSRNSYLPRLAEVDSFQKENKFLDSSAFDVRPTWTGIFTPDRKTKGLRLIKAPANSSLSCLELFDLQTGRREWRTPAMPVWKLQPVDINQDGLLEIMLIQYIHSALDNEVAKRVYIYSLNGSFHALWRGSGLSRPMLDAVFMKHQKGPPVLVALHTGDSFLLRDPKTPKRVLMSYLWNGFGFSGRKELSLNLPLERLSFRRNVLFLSDNAGRILMDISMESFDTGERE